MRNELQKQACPTCKGFGLLKVQYDQDDIKTEQCDECIGKGTRKQAVSVLPDKESDTGIQEASQDNARQSH